jgi:hypothetical protein
LPKPIHYTDKILLTGSCFTEHIGNALAETKFSVFQNPNGILFDPASVCRSLLSYIENKTYHQEDLFKLNDVWHSWDHHSRFSNVDPKEAVEKINASQKAANAFLKKANWLIITLGSSYSYRLAGAPGPSGRNGDTGVANCHRAPAQWFNKYLLEIHETVTLLEDCYNALMRFNPGLNVILTVSPVRHLRDGVVDNNRSKARLIEAVHHMTAAFGNVFYFPAYELVVDVLRDYRFYDIDLAHPNYMATEFVLEKFSQTCIDDFSRQLMQDVKKIVIARKHRALQPETNAHRDFLKSFYEKTKSLHDEYPFLRLEDELSYFSQAR